MGFQASALNVGRLRTTTAKLTFGEPLAEHEITVVFRGKTVTQGSEIAQRTGADGMILYVDYLAVYVASLPDLLGEDGEPVAINRELFADWSTANVTALHDAIETELNPPPPPSPTTPTG